MTSIGSYISGSGQRVRISNILESKLLISIGVPQGSVLAPLLSLLNINDLPNISSLLYTVLFAITRQCTHLAVATGNWSLFAMKSYSEGLWVEKSKALSLNIDKTFHIIYSNRFVDPEVSRLLQFDGQNIKFC